MIIMALPAAPKPETMSPNRPRIQTPLRSGRQAQKEVALRKTIITGAHSMRKKEKGRKERGLV